MQGFYGTWLSGSFLGSDHAEKTAEFKKENPELETASFEQCARLADLAVLCLKGTAAEKVVGQVKAELSGKTVIDATTTLLPTRLHKTGC
jgi:predicted dinucleotide-binding enzyme